MTVTTQLVSVNAAGMPLNGANSGSASISADGTKVLYFNPTDADLYDTTTNTTKTVNTASGGADGFFPDLAFDGFQAVYEDGNNLVRQSLSSNASQVISAEAEIGHASDNGSVVAYTQPSGGTSLAAFDIFDVSGNQTKGQFATNNVDADTVDGISGDGRFVAFEAAATGGAQFGVASGGNTEIYLGDVANLATATLISVNDLGQFATNGGQDADNSGASVSDDGKFVAFMSDATNLAFDASGNPIPTNGQNEIYLRDTANNTTELISKSASGAAAVSVDDQPTISSDGKYVLFDAAGSLLPSGGDTEQVFVYNVETGSLTLLSQQANGAPSAGSDSDNGGSSFSADDTSAIYQTSVSGKDVVALATTSGVTTIQLDPVAGDSVVNATEANAGFSITGTTTNAVGDTVELFFDGNNGTIGTPVSIGTVAADGTFSVTLPPNTLTALSQGGHTLLATVQGDPTSSYLSGSTTASFAIDISTTSVNPTVTITSPAEQSNHANQVIAGTVVAGGAASVANQAVSLTDNGTMLASGTTDQNGNFSIAVTLPNPGANSIVASSQDSFGNSGTSAAIVDTLNLPVVPPPPPPPPAGDTTPPTISFDPGVSFLSPTNATLTGTVADNVGVASVGIFEGETFLGSAAIDASGTWSFTADFAPGLHTSLSAVATDTSGNTHGQPASVPAPARPHEVGEHRPLPWHRGGRRPGSVRAD